MTPFFTDLFQYVHKANRDVISVMLQYPAQVSERSLLLCSHILSAHHLWNHRILGQPSQYKPWDLHQLSDFMTIDEYNLNTTLYILENYEFGTLISYTTSHGQPFTHPLRDLLFHAANHATYHRGQVTTELKLAGIQPPPTDYIYYKMQ